jgi:flagellar biosynthetic protein FliO
MSVCRRSICLFSWLILTIAPTVVLAQEIERATTRPATQPASAYDGKSVFPNRTPGEKTVQNNGDPSSINMTRWGLSLGVVIGIILLMAYLSKRMMNPGGKGGADAMTVLARQNISPRQQLMLVQVGRRVVMVGNSGSQMNALAEITDPDEIADVMNRCNRRKKAAAEAFTDLFSKAERDFDPSVEEKAVAEENSSAADSQLIKTKNELTNLLEKVRGMTKKNGQNLPKDQK